MGSLFPHVATSQFGSPLAHAFDKEGALLDHYCDIRQRFLDALARIGSAVPDAIVRRATLTFRSLITENERPVTSEELLGLVRATEPPAETVGPEPALTARGAALNLIRRRVGANSLIVRSCEIADTLTAAGFGSERAAVLLELQRDGVLVPIPNPISAQGRIK